MKRIQLKKIICIFAGLIVVVGGIYLVSSYSLQPASSTGNNEIVQTNNTEVELGDISMKDGVKQIEFGFKNTTGQDLEISLLYTSCMCTKARVEVNGKLSNFAGMKGHGSGLGPINPKMTIGKDQEGKVFVEFDPNAHGPQGTGPITRSIILETSNTQTPQMQFTFSGVVTK